MDWLFVFFCFLCFYFIVVAVSTCIDCFFFDSYGDVDDKLMGVAEWMATWMQMRCGASSITGVRVSNTFE